MDIARLLARPINAFLILATGIFAHLSLRGDTQSDYFSNPQPYSVDELSQELKKKTLDMCWNFGQDSHFRFISGNDETYFEVYLGNLPEMYSDFIARVKHQFIVSENSTRLVFSYKLKNDGSEEFNGPESSQQKGHPDEYSYIVADRRIIDNASPERMSQDELTAVVRDKKVLFYSGAGLSLASNVPAMNELNELLGLEVSERFLFSLEGALDNPREFASKIRKFHEASLFSTPTKAHFALKDLSVFKNIRIVTENLDALHETSGIYPYRVDPDHLRNEVGGQALAQFDYIICVGLSYDDRGFLGWYKQHNPQGKIIAIDLNQPSYLGDEDFLVRGDIQEILPAVHQTLMPK